MTGPKGDAVTTKGGETSPLFPRLHVNDTEKAGPRAPPRNKMALFEQFTIPSHRFVPSKVVASPHNQQYGSRDRLYQHPVFSYYIPRMEQYTSSNQGFSTNSHLSHGASGDTVMRGCGDIESRSVPGCQFVEPNQLEVMRAEGTAGGTCRSKNDVEGKTLSVNDLSVPVLSACAKSDKVFVIPVAHEWSEDCSCEAVGAGISILKPCIKVRLQEALPSSKPGMGFPLAEMQMGAHQNVKLIEQTGQSDASEVVDEIYLSKQASSPLQTSKNVSCMSDSEDGFPSSIEIRKAHGQCTEADESMVTIGEQPYTAKGSAGASNLEPLKSLVLLDKAALKSSSCITTADMAPEDNKGVGVSISTAVSAGSRRDECSEGTEIYRPESNEIRASVSDETDESGLHSLPPAMSFRPKDVIGAFGQQQFWKARKSILRQQRIFSEQVFELHKLIQIQHLLAGTPTVLVHEDLYFGKAISLLESEEVHAYGDSNKLDQTRHPVNEISRAPPPGAEVHSLVSPLRRNNESTGTVPGGVYTSSPLSAPVGESAWGYPSFGMGQWMRPMALQAGPFVYEPLAGALPPFGGAYGSTNWRPVSSMVPYSWTEMSSNMQPRLGIDPTCQWQPGMYPSLAAPLATPDWYALQHQDMIYNQRLELDSGPAASLASINYTQGGSRQSMKVLNVESLQCGVASEGFNSSGSRNGSLPSLCMKTNCSRDASNLDTQFKSVDVSQQSLSESLDLASACKPVRSNRYGGDWAVVGNCHSPFRGRAGEGKSDTDHTARALNLFPLAPSLSLNYLSEGSISTGQLAGCQGRVIKAVPRPAIAASKSAAGILLSLQQERQL